MSDDEPFALVLSGGGARGAFGAGVVAALDELGLQPDIVSGTSAGAITGSGVAMGWEADRIVELWSSLHSHDVYRPRADIHRLVDLTELPIDPRAWLGIGARTAPDEVLSAVGWTWLFDLSPLRDLLVTEIGGEHIDVADGVTLTLSTIEVATGRVLRYANTPVPDAQRDDEQTHVVDLTVDHVLASSALPGVFEPIRIDDREHWDGGLTSNTPLNASLVHDPARVLVVGASPERPDITPPSSFGDVLALALDHVLRSAMFRDVDHARTVNRLVRAGGDDTFHREVEIEVVVPEEPMRGLGDLLDFQPEVTRRLIEEGRRRALDRCRERGWA